MAFLDILFIYIFLDVFFPNECKWGANTNAYNLLEIHLLVTLYIPFRMNATKEHTQLHTTYSRCITLQALFTYYYFSFSFFFLFLVLIHYWKACIICIMAIVSLRLLKTLRNLNLNRYYLSLKYLTSRLIHYLDLKNKKNKKKNLWPILNETFKLLPIEHKK